MVISKLIAHMEALRAKKVKYSMYGSRTGSDGTADCSGAIYAALVTGGGARAKYPPSTETLHAYLTSNGYQLHATNREWSPKRGDIFIWGKRGQSAGAGGHTGVFTDSKRIIHCNASANGVSVDDYAIAHFNSGRMYFYAYRPKTSQTSQKQPNTPQEGANIMPKSLKLTDKAKLYTKPSKSGGLIATLKAGDIVKFDDITHKEGILWACQRRAKGYGYIELGTLKSHGTLS